MLINLHQLKTAGKSLEGIFYRNYKDKLLLTKKYKNSEKIHIKDMYKILDKIYKNELKNKSVITGHILLVLTKITRI